MKASIYTVLCCLFLFACKSGEKEETKQSTGESFISIRSLVEQQVAHVDTSLYAIIKVTTRDSSRQDTAYIPREQFREVARDFLSIPDLADPAVAKDYVADPVQYDETINRVIITYKPADPDRSEIKKQELLVTPASATGDKVNNIMIHREISNRDSFVKKDMLWIMDKSFQVTTTRQLKGQPEVMTIERVVWNND